MKGYTVFNVEQIEGLPAQFYPKPEPRSEDLLRIERAEAFFAATKAVIRYGLTTLAAGGSMYDPRREEREKIQVAVTRRKLTKNGAR